jgi:hypothetical protein
VLLYNCFREPEPQILDYRTQQYKLFPYLAASFALKFTGMWLLNMHEEVISELEGGDLERLPEVVFIQLLMYSLCVDYSKCALTKLSDQRIYLLHIHG